MREGLSLAWFLVGSVICGGAAYRLTLPEADPGARRTSSVDRSGVAPPRGAERSGAATAARDRSTVLAAEVDERPRDTVAGLREQLLELRHSASASSGDYAELLRQLVMRGEPGVTVALELMGDVGFDFPWRGRAFLEAFEGCRDERVYPAIVELLERYQGEGLTFKAFRDGYYQMMARHGGSDGARRLWELARDDASDVVAVRALAEVRDPTVVDQVLAELGTAGEFANPDLAEALAAWDDPRMVRRLTDLGLDSSLPERFRKNALSGVASRADEGSAYALVSEYWKCSDADERAIVLKAVYGLGANGRLSARKKAALGEPILVAALRSPERRVRSGALTAVSDNPCYWTPEIESIVAEMLEAGLADREELRLLLGRMRSPRR